MSRAAPTRGLRSGRRMRLHAAGQGPDDRLAWAVARRVLGDIGLDVTAGPPDGPDAACPGAVLPPLPPHWARTGGLPGSTLTVANGYALAAAAIVASLAGGEVRVAPDLVAAHLHLPLVVAAATGTEPAAGPSEPWPTADGAVCADVGAGDDREAFARLLDVLGPERPSAEPLAAAAQEWRLPVTPYRRRPGDAARAGCGVRGGPVIELAAAPGERSRPGGVGARGPLDPRRPRSAGNDEAPLRGVTVVDLTVMWSGPLCTRLLVDLGARVVKIEPDCRLDGTRSSPGGNLHRALNRRKERAALDLRRAADRTRFDELVAAADLVVDNFSPRVAGNLGITPAALREVNPGVATLSLPAFPPGPERQWVSYGTGIHAWSGLGDLGEPGNSRGFAAPAVTYPDPLAGLAALVAALALLAAGDDGAAGASAEVSLAGAVGPLVEVADPEPLRRPADLGTVRSLAARWGAVPPAPLGRDEPFPAGGGGRPVPPDGAREVAARGR